MSIVAPSNFIYQRTKSYQYKNYAISSSKVGSFGKLNEGLIMYI